MPTINMRSQALSVKGQGVGSCYEEQVELVKSGLTPEFTITENARGFFDIVHYHTINPTYFVERLLTKRRSVGVGYVHFLPDTLEESLHLPRFIRYIVYKYVLAFYNSMDYLVTVNPFMIQRIHDYGIHKPEVSCITNYVSEERFPIMDKVAIQAVKQKYGMDEQRFVVLGVGQLQTRKGVIDFVETAKLLPEITFVWAGGFSFGRITDGYEEIKKIVENPPSNMIFTGIVDRSEMPGLYNACDVMFLPSFEELFPMSILEALCCKKPILLRDVPLYESILMSGYRKGKNPTEFSQCIQELAGCDETYRVWQEKAWELHKLYLKDATLQKWRTFYRSVCLRQVDEFKEQEVDI